MDIRFLNELDLNKIKFLISLNKIFYIPKNIRNTLRAGSFVLRLSTTKAKAAAPERRLAAGPPATLMISLRRIRHMRSSDMNVSPPVMPERGRSFNLPDSRFIQIGPMATASKRKPMLQPDSGALSCLNFVCGDTYRKKSPLFWNSAQICPIRLL